MSDVDRLRAAADVCLRQAFGDPLPFDFALAELLSAVADQRDVVPFGVLGAANTLADTILGVGDE